MLVPPDAFLHCGIDVVPGVRGVTYTHGVKWHGKSVLSHAAFYIVRDSTGGTTVSTFSRWRDNTYCYR